MNGFWDAADLKRQARLAKLEVEMTYILTGRVNLSPSDIDNLTYARDRINQMLEESKSNAA